MFKSICPHCSQDYSLDDSLLGKTATCKRCRNVFLLTESATRSTRAVVTSAELPSDDSGFDIRKSTVHAAVPPVPPPPLKPEKRFPPNSGMWNVGDVILDIYEVKPITPELPFAEGGLGVVNRIYHREWDMDIAVKSPKPEAFKTETGKKNYEREAQTWIELGLHPNIVTCFLVRRITDIPRLFSEFVPDGSLRDWIGDGRLYHGGNEAALLRILDIATQFAWGLDYAHRQKLLHLDVKPANVMMSGQTAKVSDFGLAQSAADMRDSTARNDGKTPPGGNSSKNVPAGGLTPGYCSPEQFAAFTFAKNGEFNKMPKMTVQSDIWSWGVSLLAMFCGAAPCKKGGQTARKVCEMLLNAEPKAKGIPIPSAVGDLLMHCFETNPKDRPESMEQIAEQLTKIYRDIAGHDFPRSRPIIATWTPESINNRAASMLDLNKPAEAAKLFDQVLTLQPWHPEVTYNQTLLAWRTARMTDLAALERLETLVKMRPKESGALYALGLLQRERGNHPSALESFENALNLEDREDIKRTLAATELTIPNTAKCMDRFNIVRGGEDKIYAEVLGEFFLFPVSTETIQLCESVTGRSKISFKIIKKEQQQAANRLALSDDLLWELIPGEIRGTLICKRVGAEKVTGTFRRVAWRRYFEHGEGKVPTEPMTLSNVPWFAQINGFNVHLFDKMTKKKIGELAGHEDVVTALTLSLDGRFALTGSEDQTVRVWELPSGRCVRTFTSIGGTVDAVYFDPSNRYALSLTAGGQLRLWNIASLCFPKSAFHAPLLISHVTSSEEVGRQQAEMDRYCNAIRRAVRELDIAGALQIIEKAETLNRWETARNTLDAEGIGDLVQRHSVRKNLANVLCTHTLLGHNDIVSTVATSLDANIIASSGRDATIRIWNVTEQQCVNIIEGHTDWVRSIEMTVDSKFLVSGSWDNSVRVWNLGNGQCVRKFDEKVKYVTKVALNPQGRLVAIANGSGSLILWDVLTDEVVFRTIAHSDSVNTIRFNRNGHYLVTGGDDNIVKIWQLGQEEPTRTINVHKAPITSATLSTDLTRLYSADKSGRVVVWNLLTDAVEYEFQGHLNDITALEPLSDDQFILTCAKDGKVRLSGLEDRSMCRIIEGHPAPIQALSLEISGRHFVTGSDDAVVRVWELHWNYQFPGWSQVTPKAESVLKILLSLYSPDIFGLETPKIDEAVMKRIVLEMTYRGFGIIPQEELKRTIDRLLADWQGPGTVGRI